MATWTFIKPHTPCTAARETPLGVAPRVGAVGDVRERRDEAQKQNIGPRTKD